MCCADAFLSAQAAARRAAEQLLAQLSAVGATLTQLKRCTSRNLAPTAAATCSAIRPGCVSPSGHGDPEEHRVCLHLHTSSAQWHYHEPNTVLCH